MGYRAYSRAERKVQIVASLAINVQHGKSPVLTMYGIAKRLDIRPSTHLLKILAEMVNSGDLTVLYVEHRPNSIKGLYRLPEGSYTLPKTQRREIKLSRAGLTYERLLI
jgi:hypothetical protein